jgi:hypothetical protein
MYSATPANFHVPGVGAAPRRPNSAATPAYGMGSTPGHGSHYSQSKGLNLVRSVAPPLKEPVESRYVSTQKDTGNMICSVRMAVINIHRLPNPRYHTPLPEKQITDAHSVIPPATHYNYGPRVSPPRRARGPGSVRSPNDAAPLTALALLDSDTPLQPLFSTYAYYAGNGNVTTQSSRRGSVHSNGVGGANANKNDHHRERERESPRAAPQSHTRRPSEVPTEAAGGLVETGRSRNSSERQVHSQSQSQSQSHNLHTNDLLRPRVLANGADAQPAPAIRPDQTGRTPHTSQRQQRERDWFSTSNRKHYRSSQHSLSLSHAHAHASAKNSRLDQHSQVLTVSRPYSATPNRAIVTADVLAHQGTRALAHAVMQGRSESAPLPDPAETRYGTPPAHVQVARHAEELGLVPATNYSYGPSLPFPTR